MIEVVKVYRSELNKTSLLFVSSVYDSHLQIPIIVKEKLREKYQRNDVRISAVERTENISEDCIDFTVTFKFQGIND